MHIKRLFAGHCQGALGPQGFCQRLGVNAFLQEETGALTCLFKEWTFLSLAWGGVSGAILVATPCLPQAGLLV